ncbi:MAG TPA: hypothetical protein VJ745_02205 [Gaiellaceae bacterium]|nr:hypothetical protein [Gaiellaceae bacterium]
MIDETITFLVLGVVVAVFSPSQLLMPLAFGTFAPPLAKAGNSVKGQCLAKFLSRRLGLDLFASKPET